MNLTLTETKHADTNIDPNMLKLNILLAQNDAAHARRLRLAVLHSKNFKDLKKQIEGIVKQLVETNNNVFRQHGIEINI